MRHAIATKDDHRSILAGQQHRNAAFLSAGTKQTRTHQLPFALAGQRLPVIALCLADPIPDLRRHRDHEPTRPGYRRRIGLPDASEFVISTSTTSGWPSPFRSQTAGGTQFDSDTCWLGSAGQGRDHSTVAILAAKCHGLKTLPIGQEFRDQDVAGAVTIDVSHGW